MWYSEIHVLCFIVALPFLLLYSQILIPNIRYNRNNSKSNSGPQSIGDGMISMPIGTQITNDPDHQDTVEVAGHDIVHTPTL